MYDFNNGRFLSVDPFIQGTGSNAINPYSYIHNNPLSGVDPTGYVSEGLNKGCGYFEVCSFEKYREGGFGRNGQLSMTAKSNGKSKNQSSDKNSDDEVSDTEERNDLNNENSDGMTLKNENIMAVKRNRDGTITLNSYGHKKVIPRLKATILSNGNDELEDFLLESGKELRDLSDKTDFEHCSSICKKEDKANNKTFFELKIHTNKSHVACYTQGKSCSSGFNKMRNANNKVIEIHSHGTKKKVNANYADYLLGGFPEGKNIYNQSLNEFSDQGFNKEGYLSGEKGLWHQKGRKTVRYVGDYKK